MRFVKNYFILFLGCRGVGKRERSDPRRLPKDDRKDGRESQHHLRQDRPR
jgi:hypothetical protein